MATGVKAPARARIAARTLRTDRWWLQPAAVVTGLVAWLTYSVVRVFLQENYWVGEHHYLTPFYSPCVSEGCIPAASHFGQVLPDHPLLPYAAFSLPLLLLFRLTCYYYRKAYYRAFWLSPPACAVAEPHGRYTGETRFPLIFQNSHRWFFYASFVIACVLSFDAIIAFRNEDHEWGHMGLGTLILVINSILIWLYTLSCHSCRHIMGGRLRNFSKHPIRYRLWGMVSRLNGRHGQWAWASLISVALADLYIYLLAIGAISDVRFF